MAVSAHVCIAVEQVNLGCVSYRLFPHAAPLSATIKALDWPRCFALPYVCISNAPSKCPDLQTQSKGLIVDGAHIRGTGPYGLTPFSDLYKLCA